LVREDADHVGPALDLFVEALERVRAGQLGPMPGGEGHVGKDVVLALVPQRCELGPAGAAPVGHLPPGLTGGRLIGLQERLAQCRGDPTLVALGQVREGGAHPVPAAALPAAAKHPGDRLLQPFMG
jgi:hypothetical protein